MEQTGERISLKDISHLFFFYILLKAFFDAFVETSLALARGAVCAFDDCLARRIRT